MIITDSKLKKFCLDCDRSYTCIKWCKECNSKQFQKDFSNWTSENEFIDKFIQETQLNAQHNSEVLEWIPYNKFKRIEEIGIVYKAIWLNGPIKEWSNNEGKWIRYNDKMVALKNLDDFSKLSEAFLNKV